jgi:hypothetical protein
MLTFEGQQFVGPTNIVEKLAVRYKSDVYNVGINEFEM